MEIWKYNEHDAQIGCQRMAKEVLGQVVIKRWKKNAYLCRPA